MDDADPGGVLAVDCKVGGRDGVEAAIARAVATRWELHRLERRQPTLENVFLHYIGAVRPEKRAAEKQAAEEQAAKEQAA